MKEPADKKKRGRAKEADRGSQPPELTAEAADLRGPAREPAAGAAEAVRHDRSGQTLELTGEAILRELAAIAFSDFTDYVRVEDGAVVLTDSRALDQPHRAAIAGIKDIGKGVEIKLHDKQKALELLAKYLGVFDRPAEPEGLRVVLPEEAEEWAE